MSTIVSADDIKKELAGYAPEQAERFHSESAKRADKLFDGYLQSVNHETVVLMSGGPASGKTEFISEYLIEEDLLVFDGILPTEAGAKIKIDHIRKTGKQIKIYAVWPQDFKQAYVAFLHRDRKFSDEHFYMKHAAARKTLLWMAREYPSVEIKLFKNAYLSNDLSFTELQFDSNDDLIEFLEENQYTPEEIKKLVIE